MRVRRLIVPVLVGRPPFFMPYHKMGIGVLKSHNCSLNAAQILRFALNFRAITNDSKKWWNALRLGMRYGFLALTPRPFPCCDSKMRRNNSLSADFPRVTAYCEAELSRVLFGEVWNILASLLLRRRLRQASGCRSFFLSPSILGNDTVLYHSRSRRT